MSNAQLVPSNGATTHHVRIRSRALEVVYRGHLGLEAVLDSLRQARYGVYKAFIKWHEKPEAHTHVGLILRDKPDLAVATGAHKSYFSVGGVQPTLVKPLGKGNRNPTKKLSTYVSYLTDGHDNGNMKDTASYKYDHEISSCGKDVAAQILVHLTRDLTWDTIYQQADWKTRLFMADKKKALLNAYREYKSVMKKPAPATLRPWQDESLQLLFDQSDRQIDVVLDPSGDSGKSFLHRELILHHNAFGCNNAKTADLAYGYDGQPIVSINLTRTVDGRVNYEAFEQLKDGCMYSGKYESAMKIHEPPAMIFFTNFELDWDSMSQDRWRVWTIQNGHLVPRT